LDPFRREAYLIKYSQNPRDAATIVIGKDTFTKRAEAHPDHRGMQAGVIVERNGEIVEQVGSFVMASDKVVGGWAKVWKADREVPYYVTVSFDEYVGRKNNGDINRQWATKPATMIRKVALVQALREAYPDALGGMYDASEMSHIDTSALSEKDVTPPAQPVAEQDFAETVVGEPETPDETDPQEEMF
jgi:phage recombination protein Bet